MAVNINIPKPTYTKNDIGLGNVDNTSDLNKPISTATQTALDGKVDKVTGKGLSENDFTNTLKTKLDGIQDGAEVNVNADWNATSGDAQILNKPTIPSISGLVPYTGATADVDLDTFGLDAKFIKIKGTGGNGHLNLKHQSSGATAGGSESVLYADASGNPKWKNDGNAVQDVLLSGTTTADIADSTNKRYVTDAQLTVLNNASFNRKIVGSTNANTTTETILATFTITANTLSANDVLKIMASTIKTNTNGSYTLRIRHNTSNTLVGATQIALLSVSTLANVNANFSRQNFIITGGNLTGFSFTTSVLSDINSQFSGALSSIAFDVAIENCIFITVQLSSASDLCSLRFANIQNF